MRRLDLDEQRSARALLIGARGPVVLDAMFELALGTRPPSAEVVDWLEEVGWWRTGALTELGALARDSAREYGFWTRRDRALPSEHVASTLARERYRDKRVLELGSGAGCNLFVLAGVTEQTVGVEPMPVHAQLGEILAEREGLTPPRVVQAVGARLPFATGSFDRVICYSSHQYMNVQRAIAEAARVLAPDGELVMVGNSLGTFVFESARRLVVERDLGTAKYDTTAIVNTLTYQLFERRAFEGGPESTTSVPIYPTLGHLRRYLHGAGLAWDREQTERLPTGETALVARKAEGARGDARKRDDERPRV